MKNKILTALFLLVSIISYSQNEDCGTFCPGDVVFFPITCPAGASPFASVGVNFQQPVAGGINITMPQLLTDYTTCFVCRCDDALEDGVTFCESEPICKDYTLGAADLSCECAFNIVGNGQPYQADPDCTVERCTDLFLSAFEDGALISSTAYTFAWSTGATTRSISLPFDEANCNPTPQNYSVTITEINGCGEEVKDFTVVDKCVEITTEGCPTGN